MSFEQITVSVADGICTILLNRPEKLNAYTRQMGAELHEAFVRADADDDVRAIIVTGAGRGFCAGADISPDGNIFSNKEADAGQPPRGEFALAIYRCRKPSIAAINGASIGAGLTMTLPMDVRIASTTAKFGFTFSRLGMVPELASSWFLPRIVGMGKALRWCYSGRVFGAEEALGGGLVDELVAPEQLLDRAVEIAREMVSGTAPVAVALTRQMFWRLSAAPSPEDAIEIDRAFVAALETSPDLAEGIAAFGEKRVPRFPGRVSTDLPPPYPWWEAP